jgi:hypothetical protein
MVLPLLAAMIFGAANAAVDPSTVKRVHLIHVREQSACHPRSICTDAPVNPSPPHPGC